MTYYVAAFCLFVLGFNILVNIFQVCRDGATASWLLTSPLGSLYFLPWTQRGAQRGDRTKDLLN